MKGMGENTICIKYVQVRRVGMATIRDSPPKMSTSPDSNKTLSVSSFHCFLYRNSAESPTDKDMIGDLIVCCSLRER